MSAFTDVDTLDFALAGKPDTRQDFLQQLRDALIKVGMFYITDSAIDPTLIGRVKEQCDAFFQLPSEKKVEIDLGNVPSFLGYTRLATEKTGRKTDYREHLSLSTLHDPPLPSEPRYRNLLGPNQWPDASFLPQFRPTYEDYLQQMQAFATDLISCIAEALGLSADAFDGFFDSHQQHRLKVIRYPDLTTVAELNSDPQSLGAHKDSQIITIILQASKHDCLQVSNCAGDWINCPPVPGTFIVAVGEALEVMTHNVCVAATHRVLPPQPGSGDRYSLTFSKSVSLDISIKSLDMPSELEVLRNQIKAQYPERKDEVETTYDGVFEDVGEKSLDQRLKSFPLAGQKWYPDLTHRVETRAATRA